MNCLHNHDQILEFLRKIFLKGFQIYQNYLCALTLKVPEKLQLYGLYVYYVVHICDFGMLRVNISKSRGIWILVVKTNKQTNRPTPSLELQLMNMWYEFATLLNPKRAGGGGIGPPLDVSRDNFVENFSRAASFHDFFLWSLAQLLALFSGKSGV